MATFENLLKRAHAHQPLRLIHELSSSLKDRVQTKRELSLRAAPIPIFVKGLPFHLQRLMGSRDKSPAHSHRAVKRILWEGGPQSAVSRGAQTCFQRMINGNDNAVNKYYSEGQENTVLVLLVLLYDFIFWLAFTILSG
ncbi:hypothetical protein E5288_WYG009417 [Bos mutus]|uniref:Uncharacterized protein n=1 Tax=Bos mutus TaxID=72004 RepID=A0A6B0R9P2_9CETA|nr:hypothetical protein [Bos mutus]